MHIDGSRHAVWNGHHLHTSVASAAMKMKDTLAKFQREHQCEHVREFGDPCDLNSGGWWTCMCAVAADKIVREYQRGLAASVTNGQRGQEAE